MTHIRPYTVQGPQGTINVLCGKSCNIHYNATAHKGTWQIDVYSDKYTIGSITLEDDDYEGALTDNTVMLAIINAYTLGELEI